MVWWALVAGNLVIGIFFAYIFGRWANITNPMTGLQAGGVIGFLMATGFGLNSLGTTHIMSLNGTLLDILVWTVISAILGATAAWMLGRGK